MKFLLIITLLASFGCQQRPVKDDEILVEVKQLLKELNECQNTLAEERTENIRKVIRNEILPEVREIKLYSNKVIRNQITHKNEAIKKILIGRVEWIETEDGKARFKARVDTGAQTNSIHAVNINEKSIDGIDYVEFDTVDADFKKVSFIEKVVKKTAVKNTMGISQNRYVIQMAFKFGDRTLKTNVNLNDRSNLKHKFLIGRNLLIGEYLVDVSQSRLLGGKK
jgi:hypothetical protein